MILNSFKPFQLANRKPTIAEFVPVFALVIFFAFTGFRTGTGGKLKQRMVDKDFSYKNVITFQNNETINTAIIGQNSLYVFYVAEGDDKLSIAPISQNIKHITTRKVTEAKEKSEVSKNKTAPNEIKKPTK